MANYPQQLAQDAVCQSHTGHMTGLWFLPSPAFKAEHELMNEYAFIYYSLSVLFYASLEVSVLKRRGGSQLKVNEIWGPSLDSRFPPTIKFKIHSKINVQA